MPRSLPSTGRRRSKAGGCSEYPTPTPDRTQR
nr:MAG TPA: hypothetical protein [Caudoviricetes sp.]